MPRKEILETGHVYHIFNRSIAGYVIFNNPTEYTRMVDTFRHYHEIFNPGRFSSLTNEGSPSQPAGENRAGAKPVEIIAYCLMPTHFHLVLRQVSDRGIFRFISNTQNSYTRYFNNKHQRKGPLWEGRFKNVLVKTDEQLLHLTRYVHLNPVTADLASLPEHWAFSSYREYALLKERLSNPLCKKDLLLDIMPEDYSSFVIDHIAYQKELAQIKHLLLE